MNNLPQKLDMHIHTTASDGTDGPEELLEKIKRAGIGLFAVTDHDAVKSCAVLLRLLREEADGPRFVCGVEFSCRDERGRYHILGYGFDPDGESIRAAVGRAHDIRMEKARARLAGLEAQFGFVFPPRERAALLALDNPGRPHIGLLMTRLGWTENKEQAIEEYIDRVKTPGISALRPQEAIRAIAGSGGVAVLAHAPFGDGGQHVEENELDRRVRALKDMGLEGLECYYSGYTPRLQGEMLGLARRYDLLVSAGSDYHGANKTVRLGETHLDRTNADPRLAALLERLAQRKGTVKG